MQLLVDPTEDLSNDEFDAQLIIDWLETYSLVDASRVPPAPTSAREGELKWAHDNLAAWRLVKDSVLRGYGLDLLRAQQLMANHVSLRFNPHHDAQGKFATGPGGGTGEGKAGYRPGGWKPTRDRDAEVDAKAREYARAIATIVPPEWSNERIADRAYRMAERAVPPSGSVILRNGPHDITIDPDALLSDDDTSRLTGLIDGHLVDHPPREGHLHVTIEPDVKFDPSVLGETLINPAIGGTGEMRLNSRMFSPETRLRGLMPTSGTVDPATYTVAHEWGHTQQPPVTSHAFWALYQMPQSKYGSTTSYEAYAENWTEWDLSKGLTKDPTTIAYAKAFGWK